MLLKETMKDYIDEVSSKSPTPGGGSVSALAGTLAGALATMVIHLTVDKKEYEQLSEQTLKQLNFHQTRLSETQKRLAEIVTEDTLAFDEVMKAFKLPKGDERTSAIQSGYKGALSVPLECAQLCLQVLTSIEVWTPYGNKNCISDIGVGALLAHAGLEGALLNVLINLSSIKDESYTEEIKHSVNNLLTEGNRLKSEIMKVVYKGLEA